MNAEHEPGCLSCFPFRRRSRSKPVVRGVTFPTIPQQITPLDAENATPTTGEYAFEATKTTITLLQKVAGSTGIPFAEDALAVALALLNACEEVLAVEERIKDLKNHICQLMLLMVDAIHGKSAADISQDLVADISRLSERLTTIRTDLDQIKQQSRWLLIIFTGLNKSKVEDCVKSLQVALERFHTVCAIRTATDLQRVQRRLEEIYGNTERILEEVVEVRDTVGMIDSKVDDLRILLRKQHAHGASILPSGEMPLPPRIFYGRALLVGEISFRLASGEKPRPWVAILGPGGMGKTSVALAVMEHEVVKKQFLKVNTFWVPCIGATSPSALLQHLYSYLRITRDTNDRLADILYELKASQEPRVILLDNFDTPWHLMEGNQSQVAEILRALRTLPHVAILLTMRSEFPPCADDISWEIKKLGAIDVENSRRIYTEIDPIAENSKHLGDLLHGLGYLPFAVTLMAKLGKQSGSRPEDLLQEWNQNGTNMLSDPESGLNRCISLSVDSKFIRETPEALVLLATLSLLPAGTERRNLSWWAPGLKNVSKAMATLRDAALVLVSKTTTRDQSTTRLFVLPVVQSFMPRTDHVSEGVRKNVQNACYEFLRSHNSTPNDTTFTENIKMIAEEETNIEAILQDAANTIFSDATNPVSLDLLDALVTFSWYHRWSKPRTDIAERAIRLAEQANDLRRLAHALFCLGMILFCIDKYHEASSRFMEAQKLFASLADGHGPDYFNSALCRIQAARVSEYLMLLPSQVWQLMDGARKDCEQSDNPIGKAHFLLALGEAHSYSGDHTESFAVLQQARKAFDELGQPLETAHCLYELARMHAFQSQHDKALEIIEDAISRYDKLGVEDRGCDSWQVKICCLKSLEHSADELLSALRFALEKTQRMGSPLVMGQILEEYGEVYINLGDYAAARVSYEGALKEYHGLSGGTVINGVRRCESNLQYLAWKETGNGSAVSFCAPVRY